ncbi:P-loop containing nucleoside triphosphate hydrolase protein [Artomyces pyxidatus]|uniref:P-loop containing nucleoside triphosphate hydrolase protein n=1 Tax=Artomyces pyxidatus TaxID=48021 RepID=A0ACB8TKW2_9AGAM|nr:P-loop containing nucleoside triphosphate hydrolase protein [Artomyces pyxidatus]
MSVSSIPLQFFLSDFWIPTIDGLEHSEPCKHDSPAEPDSIYDAWLASRHTLPEGVGRGVPGASRPITVTNLKLAHRMAKLCAPEMLKLFWSHHPLRALLMVSISFVRGIFPVFKGYSHAMIINEVQSLISSGHFTWPHLVRLLGTEFLRVVLEKYLDSFATNNEHLVQSSARFSVEYQQMEQRVRLDVPTLSDPIVRDLLSESDLFVSSFQGVGGFGLLSPFDFIRIFTLLSELVSHIYILSTLQYGPLPLITLAFSLLSTAYPFFQSSFMLYRYGFEVPAFTDNDMRLAEKQEQMRQLSLSESHRPEVMLFGLGPWILDTWAAAREAGLGINPSRRPQESIFSHMNVAEVLTALQNIPFVLMLQSSTSLGSLSLYRSSIQSIVYTVSNLFITVQMAIQGIFLMGAFCASMQIEPLLQPKREEKVKYESKTGGMRIEARNLSFTYPGCTEPALKNVSFTLEAGETLALVGYNGSGKSTLGKLLLRIVDFNSGELYINDVDIRRHDPAELHAATTAVFQGFSKYNGTVSENVGVGYVADIACPEALRRAVRLAESERIVDGLPQGIDTRLDAYGFDAPPPPPGPMPTCGGARPAWMPHGLSGGEWQRIALARAFMRAGRPEVHLLLFDEPTSALDAHAQNKICDTIDAIARAPSGRRTKTVVFITHRLATARRADKIAMMEHGCITEFGTHDELLARGGAYAALYRASL